MQILLPNRIAHKIIAVLRKAGNCEIGGILMGEHVAEKVFRIKDITIQRRHGSFASFVRVIEEIINPLKQFFQNTGNKFTRFNYLGEWHSHPSFFPEPSYKDCETMWKIVNDPTVGANFATLMILRLDANDKLEGTVTIFLPSEKKLSANLVIE